MSDKPDGETGRPALIAGEGRDSPSGPAQPQDDVFATPAVTRRLFAFDVSHETQKPLPQTLEARSRFWSRIRSSGGIAGPFQPTIMANELRLIAWVEPKTAVELREFPGVLAVERVKPGGPTDSKISYLRIRITQPPEIGRRHLFVVLGPNSWRVSSSAQGFHSAEDIAIVWAQWWRAKTGIEVESVSAAKWPGLRTGPVPGQIRVSVPGGTIPPDVLRTIQSHPQVLRLQWDRFDAIRSCGPCGMG